jgi:hypothetical protein
VERQLRELRLRSARAAKLSRAAAADASTGADAWLARLTGTTSAVMRGGLWLARMLDETYPAVRDAFASVASERTTHASSCGRPSRCQPG